MKYLPVKELISTCSMPADILAFATSSLENPKGNPVSTARNPASAAAAYLSRNGFSLNIKDRFAQNPNIALVPVARLIKHRYRQVFIKRNLKF